jgi:hypothetical protein
VGRTPGSEPSPHLTRHWPAAAWLYCFANARLACQFKFPLFCVLPQFVREFAKLGLTRSVGGVLALALARELTPVVTSIILAGRVGSAFAAELGTMQVRPRMGGDGATR